MMGPLYNSINTLKSLELAIISISAKLKKGEKPQAAAISSLAKLVDSFAALRAQVFEQQEEGFVSFRNRTSRYPRSHYENTQEGQKNAD